MSDLFTAKARPIREYYTSLQDSERRGALHEGNVSLAFYGLLSETARLRGWAVIGQDRVRARGKTVVPDGVVKDEHNLDRGWWEAKDPADDLLREIERKRQKGYSFKNTIFENARRAILYQNNQEVMDIGLGDPAELASLLNQFYAYTPPDIGGFKEAIREFGQQVPALATGLAKRIQTAYQSNPDFRSAFDKFFELCRTALNPNIGRTAVEEMLVQHLLTERLFRTIFEDPDFTRRNVIAAEIENVISALVLRDWNRHQFLKQLDRYFGPIEEVARTIPDFHDKQGFLNAVYQDFFQKYSKRTADTHGIVYTPQEIVKFMCASVERLLRDEFGCGIGDDGVIVLDPCTGTGNFIVNLLQQIPLRSLSAAYGNHLFANEIMLLPYYIASLNIENAFRSRLGHYQPFEGLCFVDTLQLEEGHETTISLFAEANAERVERQQQAVINVIIGNPPYNMAQANENDNNKNRKYPHADKRVADTYAKESLASNVNKLGDPYVKFFRWAADRLRSRPGIVCFVSNNSFVHKLAFDGMRKVLAREFNLIYHLDLRGDVKLNPELSGTAYNAFGIKVGVGITLAVRQPASSKRGLFYHAVPLEWKRADKLAWVERCGDVAGVPWEAITPDKRHNWIIPKHADQYATFLPLGPEKGKRARSGEKAVFGFYTLGVNTNRDEWVYDFSRHRLKEKVERLIQTYNDYVSRWQRLPNPKPDVDSFVGYDDHLIKWSRDLKVDLQRMRFAEYSDDKLRLSLFRPFTKQFLFFDRILNEEVYSVSSMFPEPGSENRVICCTNHTQTPFCVQMTDTTPNQAVGGRAGQCFPFYVYGPGGEHGQENVTDWGLEHFRKHYAAPAMSKWDIFYYVYGILHDRGYRERFADDLQRALPRIPLVRDFEKTSCLGKRLADLHIGYETAAAHKLDWANAAGKPFTTRVVDKMRLSSDRSELIVNDSLTLKGIPAAVFDYRLGRRSALEWIVDQYQVGTDDRSGIRFDANAYGGDEYVVHLVERVISVSLESLEIIDALPGLQ